MSPSRYASPMRFSSSELSADAPARLWIAKLNLTAPRPTRCLQPSYSTSKAVSAGSADDIESSSFCNLVGLSAWTKPASVAVLVFCIFVISSKFDGQPRRRRHLGHAPAMGEQPASIFDDGRVNVSDIASLRPLSSQRAASWWLQRPPAPPRPSLPAALGM